MFSTFSMQDSQDGPFPLTLNTGTSAHVGQDTRCSLCSTFIQLPLTSELNTHYLDDLFICGPALHRLRHIGDRSVCPNGDDLHRHSDRSSSEDCCVEDLRVLEGNTARSMLIRLTQGLTGQGAGRLSTELIQ